MMKIFKKKKIKKKNTATCFICKSKHRLASDFQNHILFEDIPEIHIKGSISNSDGTSVKVCNDCLAGLLYEAATTFLNPIPPFHEDVQRQ